MKSPQSQQVQRALIARMVAVHLSLWTATAVALYRMYGRLKNSEFRVAILNENEQISYNRIVLAMQRVEHHMDIIKRELSYLRDTYDPASRPASQTVAHQTPPSQFTR